MASLQDRPPPSVAAIAIGSSIIGLLTGYFLGLGSSIGVFGSAKETIKAKTKAKHSDAESSSSDSDFSDLGNPQEVSDFANSNEEYKLVLVVRTDLGMTKGKIAAQASHATLACYKTLLRSSSPILQRWERMGQAKVAVQIKSEEELEMLQAQALSLGLCAQIIHDAGRTQIAAGSATVLGVGPGPKSVVDRVTGGLKLL